MSFRIIKGELINKARGNRSLQEIADNSGGQFTRGALWQWEQGKWKPTDENIPALLKALNCEFDAISEPVNVELALN